MTVEEAIAQLQKLPDKQRKLALMLDCPHCGHAQEMATITETVVLGAAERERKESSK